jgi:Trk-type K+ transport system membrane component
MRLIALCRNTNVYEERSLGIYADDSVADDQRRAAYLGGFFDNLMTMLVFHRSKTISSETTAREDLPNGTNTSRSYFIRQQIRSQLSHDIWWICLAILFITIAEASSFESDPVDFSTFNIIFETVSAYGCVGISVGVPWAAYSFSGAWNKISKLILIAVMIRGRHRGLPVAIDKAIMLPHDSLHWAEEEDAALRSERSRSRLRRLSLGPLDSHEHV